MKIFYSLLRKLHVAGNTFPAATSAASPVDSPCHVRSSVLPFALPKHRRPRIKIASESGTELQTGIEHVFIARCSHAESSSTDGQLLTWSASDPSVVFNPPHSHVVDGVASTTAMRPAELGGLLDVTIIATVSQPSGKTDAANRGQLHGVHFKDITELQTWAYYHAWMMNPYFG